MSALAVESVPQTRAVPRSIPMTRVVSVELRKMFDTRSGFWLMASIVILSILATAATIIFAPDDELTYEAFATAVGFPMTVILPMIAALAVSSEWSQRSALTTFTLVPSRTRVIAAKAVVTVMVGVIAIALAFAIGAVGNVVGSRIAGIDTVWDVSVGHALSIVLGNLTCLLTGTMLGMLLRSSAGGLVTYFVITLLVPTMSGLLAASQSWYEDVQPWVDLNFAQSFLFEGMHTAAQWAHVASTVGLWIVLPGMLGLRWVMRSEVK
jgi:ABC-type transport system involved in multi-copper enzyme maturation permease subunit